MDASRVQRAAMFATMAALLVVALAWVYFWAPGLSIDARHLDASSYEAQFGARIFRFRVLSRAALAGLDAVLAHARPPAWLPRWSPFLGGLFVLNAAFLVATCWHLFHFTHRSRFCRLPSRSRLVAFVALSILAAAAGLTVTAYDFSAYSLLLVTAWFSFKYANDDRPRWLAVIVALTVVATLNRETAWLHVAFLAAVLVSRHGVRRAALPVVLVTAVGFAAPYVGLRVVLGLGDATHNGSNLAHNFTTPLGLLGVTAWIGATCACLHFTPRSHRRALASFHLAALPYTAMCIYAGRLEEIRLLVPLLVPQLLLARAHGLDAGHRSDGSCGRRCDVVPSS